MEPPRRAEDTSKSNDINGKKNNISSQRENNNNNKQTEPASRINQVAFEMDLALMDASGAVLWYSFEQLRASGSALS